MPGALELAEARAVGATAGAVPAVGTVAAGGFAVTGFVLVRGDATCCVGCELETGAGSGEAPTAGAGSGTGVVLA